MMTYRYVVLLLMLTVLFFSNSQLAAISSQTFSPIDEFIRWLEIAIADLQIFIEQFGANITRAIEQQLGAIADLAIALEEQFRRSIEGIQ